MSLVQDHPAIAGWYGCDDCCHPGVVEKYGPVQFYALAKIHAIIRKQDPYHLIFGTVACRVMWMWKDSYGSSGLGLDVTMAEAYGGGMDTFRGINTFPMQNSPMMNMPLPSAFSVHGLRTHSYSSLIGATMMINAFDMCGSGGQGQYQNRHTDTEIAWFGAEASELVPALFSQANLANRAKITTTIHHPLVIPRQPALVASRVFKEEHQIDVPADAVCYTIVIANGKELPATFTAQISGLEMPLTATADIAWPGSCNEPGECWPLQRIFDANYPVNISRDGASGNWSFTDIIGATATNVYRLGCYVHDHNCTAVTASKSPGSLVRPGHPFGKSNCLVLNGGFEYVSLSAGANDRNARPGGLGAVCCDGWGPAYLVHGCCTTNDDRTRMLSDPADPHSGRYSLKIVIPTSVPVWVPVPLLKKHAPGPLRHSTEYEFSLWIRSSPIGTKAYFMFGKLANTTETAGLKLLGVATRGWTKLTATFKTPAESLGAEDEKAAPLESPQIMFVPALLGDIAECGGCENLGASVWIDEVAIEPAVGF